MAKCDICGESKTACAIAGVTLNSSTQLHLSYLKKQLAERDAEIERLRLFTEIWKAARLQPDKFRHEAGEMLVRIAFEAGEISHGRAAELLGCSVMDIRERGWVQGPGLEELLKG